MITLRVCDHERLEEFFCCVGSVNCMNGIYTTPDPTNYGWKEDNKKFVPV